MLTKKSSVKFVSFLVLCPFSIGINFTEKLSQKLFKTHPFYLFICCYFFWPLLPNMSYAALKLLIIKESQTNLLSTFEQCVGDHHCDSIDFCLFNCYVCRKSLSEENRWWPFYWHRNFSGENQRHRRFNLCHTHIDSSNFIIDVLAILIWSIWIPLGDVWLCSHLFVWHHLHFNIFARNKKKQMLRWHYESTRKLR